LLSIPSLQLLYILDEVGTPASTTKVRGFQWYWVYEYETMPYGKCPPNHFLCPGPIRLLNTFPQLELHSQLVLRLLVTGADVLHSWTIPAWGLKADAVPGRLNSLRTFLERQGTFYGQCSEICGSNHSFMPIIATVYPGPSRL